MKWINPRIEYIGDIAIIKVPFNVIYKNEDILSLAEDILKKYKFIKSVWLAASPVKGELKIRDFIHLLGENRSTTIYKEHNCLFRLDIKKVFITPRLSYEHLRIANLVKENERIVNMFAGVGLFSIIIAKKSKPKIVHSIDINPEAYNYMKENINLNKVNDIVIPYVGDAKDVIEENLIDSADRVLMPLPDLALPYLKYAVLALNKEGYIHIYLHIKANKLQDPITISNEQVINALNNFNIEYKLINSKIVRTVGPRFYQVVIDVYAKKH